MAKGRLAVICAEAGCIVRIKAIRETSRYFVLVTGLS